MNPSTLEFRKQFRSTIPKYYVGWLHPVINAFLLLGSITLCLTQVHDSTWTDWLAFPAFMLFGNFSVFVIHRFPLHRPLPFMRFAYRIHTLWHHRFFTHQHVEFDSTRDFYIVFFPVHVVASYVFVGLPITGGLLYLFFPTNVVFIGMASGALYFTLYEVFHFVSHLRATHWILKFPPFYIMREHHRHHHNPELMTHYNFNLVYPLCDWLFGAYHSGAKAETRTSRQA